MNKELTGNIEASEMQCYRRALRIPYTEHVSNAEVLDRMGQERKLLGRIRECKMKYFAHVMRHSSLEKDVILGPMPGLRRQGGQRRQWATSLFGLVFRSDFSVSPKFGLSKSKPKTEVDFFLFGLSPNFGLNFGLSERLS